MLKILFAIEQLVYKLFGPCWYVSHSTNDFIVYMFTIPLVFDVVVLILDKTVFILIFIAVIVMNLIAHDLHVN